MMPDYDIEDAFAAIEDELITSMIRNMRRHRVEEIAEDKEWAMWQAMQLESLERYKKRNRKKFGSWFSDINGRIGEVLREANKQGYMDQEIEILKAIQSGFLGYRRMPDTMQAEFFKLNERKLETLIHAVEHDMEKAETAILRRADDQYRKAIFNAQVYANTGAGTYEKAVDMTTRDMLSAGLKCVVYANGAMHTLQDYADMALRTASKRAYLQGEGLKRQEWGITTVIVNKRGNPRPKCLPFCGKILIDDVWSGGSKDGISPVTGLKYPLISSAISAGLYHPRCKDSHTTYFEGISSPPDSKYTRKELDQIAEDYREGQKVQYAKQQAARFGRLAKYSLDSGNRKKYRTKENEWKSVAKASNSDILSTSDAEEEIIMTEIRNLGKINTDVLKKEFGKIRTDEIIITNERISHIKQRHPEDYDLFEQYGEESVTSPDLIIKDIKNTGTVFMIKKLSETNLNVVVRVVLETDDSKLKNSVMTFYRVREKNLRKLIEKNGLLYKKE